MDILTFIATLAGVLAWPLAVVVVFLMLRKPLLALLPQVRKLRFKEFEAEFDRDMLAVQAGVADELPAQAAQLPAPESTEARLGTLASVAPAAAVMEAWQQADGAARRLLAAHGHRIDEQTATPYSLLENALDRHALIAPKKLKIFRELRQLRNRVAHAEHFQPSAEQGLEYVHAAMALARYMDSQAEVAVAA